MDKSTISQDPPSILLPVTTHHDHYTNLYSALDGPIRPSQKPTTTLQIDSITAALHYHDYFRPLFGGDLPSSSDTSNLACSCATGLEAVSWTFYDAPETTYAWAILPVGSSIPIKQAVSCQAVPGVSSMK